MKQEQKTSQFFLYNHAIDMLSMHWQTTDQDSLHIM